MKLLLIILRFPFLIIHVAFGLFILVFFPKHKHKLSETHFFIVVTWMRILAFLLGLKIKTKGKKNDACAAFISNHVSYLDIVVLNSMLPINFIAKSEIESWPIIGYLASRSGNLFIKRGDKNSSDEMISSIKNHLSSKNKILFFPEGRIGDGISIKKFHSKLLNSIANSRLKIQPLSIRYPSNYPEDLSSDNCLVSPDDSQTLFSVGIRCLGRWSTIVLVNFEDLIDTSNLDATQIARLSAASVAKSLSI
ncbi:MAG: lysophospholipid acyltransferase family protein [Pseudomonadota bacterium]|nr:lysophospholipid acyltransferase family protein [Pseudomonadota bacterium]